MAKQKCKRGHIFDPAIYGDNCPFCPREESLTFEHRERLRRRLVEIRAESELIVPNSLDNDNLHHYHTCYMRSLNSINNNSNNIPGGILISYKNNIISNIHILYICYNYEKYNYIGQSESCDISIADDSSISSKHLSITYITTEKKFKFKDEQSSNGTYLNGNLKENGSLSNHDILTIGTTSLLFIELIKFKNLSDIDIMRNSTNYERSRK